MHDDPNPSLTVPAEEAKPLRSSTLWAEHRCCGTDCTEASESLPHSRDDTHVARTPLRQIAFHEPMVLGRPMFYRAGGTPGSPVVVRLHGMTASALDVAARVRAAAEAWGRLAAGARTSTAGSVGAAKDGGHLPCRRFQERRSGSTKRPAKPVTRQGRACLPPDPGWGDGRQARMMPVVDDFGTLPCMP